MGRNGGEEWLAEVVVGDNETFDNALRRFNRLVQNEGILAEARRRAYHEKPSVKRKKKEAAKRRKSMRSRERGREQRVLRKQI